MVTSGIARSLCFDYVLLTVLSSVFLKKMQQIKVGLFVNKRKQEKTVMSRSLHSLIYIHTYLLVRPLGAFQSQMNKAQWIKTRPQHRELYAPYSLR